jgi:hypothetical protein
MDRTETSNIVLSIREALRIVYVGLFITASFKGISQKANDKPTPPLAISKGQIIYTPDSLGNRIPDFSWCGYKAGEQPIPVLTNGVLVPISSTDLVAPLATGIKTSVGPEDATLRIQAAIDYVSKLPADKDGFRGVVVLEPGIYHIEGTLRMHTSGVVLRGAGFRYIRSALYGKGKGRNTLVQIGGKDDKIATPAINITDDYVPVNATTVHVANASAFKPGDEVIITRASTKEWIAELGADHFGGGITSLGWKPGQRVIEWRRTVTAVNGSAISFDAPLTTAIEKKYGGATIASFGWRGRIANCGIENIQLMSAYDTTNRKDEDHRWMAITVDNAKDIWVRQVNFNGFAGSAVAIYTNASRVTVEDCISMNPVSEIGGERRNTFFTEGQQTLFQRCYAEYGIHDFTTGFCAPGPNAFVQCESHLPYGFSGGLDSWSSGVLFDLVNIDGNSISFMNRGQDGQGAGWNIANSVLWNCSAARIDCYQPPTAQNWAFGSWGQFAGNGYWSESNNSIEPRSLYYAQLRERIGDAVNDRRQIMDIETDATSSPTIEQAAAMTKLAGTPAKTLFGFIDQLAKDLPLGRDINYNKAFTQKDVPVLVSPSKAAALQLIKGWLVRGNQLLTGFRSGVPWWNGTAKLYAVKNASPAITRYVPGKSGKGWTDNLDELTDSMLKKNIIGIEHNYGLWYDRRRDDHERIRREDGDVWSPFYELPFARSGKQTAWDGLSKYDLTKYNHWYWSRLKEYADLADRKGLLLVHQNYFQHNIIEAGAHYTDFPWRPANNINNTGFPEPVPYAGDKRIFMAEQFYDTTNRIRNELHKKYIRQCLDNFSDNNGVIQLIGEEFTGPLHFVQFWLNTVREWLQEKGKNQLIGLSVTKDVQDAVLADPAFTSLIDVIDIRYWYYQADGTAYAPKGGQSLAPRQHARLLKPKSTSAEQVYRAVLEYKLRFPAKAVIYSADASDRNGWAVLMAGGSLPNLKIKDPLFLQAAASMQPAKEAASIARPWMLTNEKTGLIAYDETNPTITLKVNDKSNYDVVWINTADGSAKKSGQVKGENISLSKPAGGNWVLWLKKK